MLNPSSRTQLHNFVTEDKLLISILTYAKVNSMQSNEDTFTACFPLDMSYILRRFYAFIQHINSICFSAKFILVLFSLRPSYSGRAIYDVLKVGTISDFTQKTCLDNAARSITPNTETDHGLDRNITKTRPLQ
jgi:hypothetical protein